MLEFVATTDYQKLYYYQTSTQRSRSEWFLLPIKDRNFYEADDDSGLLRLKLRASRSLCRTKAGSATSRTRCIDECPPIEISEDQTAIEVFDSPVSVEGDYGPGSNCSIPRASACTNSTL